MLKKIHLPTGTAILLAAATLFFAACAQPTADVSAPSEVVVIADTEPAPAAVEAVEADESVEAEAVAEVVAAEPATVAVTEPLTVPAVAAPGCCRCACRCGRSVGS